MILAEADAAQLLGGSLATLAGLTGVVIAFMRISSTVATRVDVSYKAQVSNLTAELARAVATIDRAEEQRDKAEQEADGWQARWIVDQTELGGLRAEVKALRGEVAQLRASGMASNAGDPPPPP